MRSSGQVDILASLRWLFAATLLPEPLVNKQVLYVYVLPAASELLSDREITFPHHLITEPMLRYYFGATSLQDGVFYNRLRGLRSAPGRAHQSKFAQFEGFAAQYLAALYWHKGIPLPGSTVQLVAAGTDSCLRFDGQMMPLYREPAHIIDCGPGLQGRFRLEQQVDMIRLRQEPYSYAAVTNGPFISRFLREHLKRYAGPEVYRQMIASNLCTCREDGIEYALDAISKAGEAAADLIIFSRLQTVEREALENGVQLAYKLLRPDGALFLRFPTDALPDEPACITGDEAIAMAVRGGFSVSDATIVKGEPRGEIARLVNTSALMRKGGNSKL